MKIRQRKGFGRPIMAFLIGAALLIIVVYGLTTLNSTQLGALSDWANTHRESANSDLSDSTSTIGGSTGPGGGTGTSGPGGGETGSGGSSGVPVSEMSPEAQETTARLIGPATYGGGESGE